MKGCIEKSCTYRTTLLARYIPEVCRGNNTDCHVETRCTKIESLYQRKSLMLKVYPKSDFYWSGRCYAYKRLLSSPNIGMARPLLYFQFRELKLPPKHFSIPAIEADLKSWDSLDKHKKVISPASLLHQFQMRKDTWVVQASQGSIVWSPHVRLNSLPNDADRLNCVFGARHIANFVSGVMWRDVTFNSFNKLGVFEGLLGNGGERDWSEPHRWSICGCSQRKSNKNCRHDQEFG